ncbi:DEAD/DEAH box helicase [Peptacetobacter hominis]|uniref:DEAD/DEAH box helicase n=1 Tax=Peptacetobacter hominis TaxID=2743610 RepID=A0A544QWN7_9FIRM|nr:DEAD/DEAH box helicase family protein [Peptacetobacter hominis]TQQ85108.1 DEAD/DEAH box helicase [Peptacetobacter hominis]
MGNDFKDIPLKLSYDSGFDDILKDFYIPVLSNAKSYDRIAGFFSSTSLATSARGLGEFIKNGGKMRLITCPQLSRSDADMLEYFSDDIDAILSDNFIQDYEEIEDKFKRDHVKALGWMLANNKLDIKIAIIKKNGHVYDREEIEKSGIMHQKVGILYDNEENIISFSGSNNESASGWIGNTEEFKVFCSWKGVEEYIYEDIKKFDSFWNDDRPDIEIKDIPSAINEHLITVSKDFEFNDIDIYKYYPEENVKEDEEEYIIENKKKEKLNLFFYQEEAVEKWEENNRWLLLQMATGCGKTRTAIKCMDNALKDTNKLLVIISCPQVTLSSQWEKDIENLDIEEHRSIRINGDIKRWDKLLLSEISKLSAGRYNNLVVYTTHKICHSDNFINILKNSSKNIIKFLIADEVHGMGAKKTRCGLLKLYKYRLGLSATPQRWFDESGSKLIESFFGNESFEFSLEDALTNINPITGKTFLAEYTYHPRFISLTEDEIEEYKKITEKIVKSSRYKDDETNDYIEMLRYNRAKIEKKAENKYKELECLLDEIGQDISDTIIFVSDSQIDRVMKILGDRNIDAARFTQERSTSISEKYNGMSERDWIIDLFKRKEYKVLVAIKCLDEGIDIPSATRAIVMASSTNPREYIQRIGRVIRQEKNKNCAEIYDMIIKPSFNLFYDDKLIEMEKRIFRKEMDRVLELSRNSINNVTINNMIYDILEEINL